MLLLMGPVLRVTEKTGEKNGKAWTLRNVFVAEGVGSIRVLLTKNIPTPGEGEVVCYEVGVQHRVAEDGRVWLDWTAYRSRTDVVVGSEPPVPARAQA